MQPWQNIVDSQQNSQTHCKTEKKPTAKEIQLTAKQTQFTAKQLLNKL